MSDMTLGGKFLDVFKTPRIGAQDVDRTVLPLLPTFYLRLSEGFNEKAPVEALGELWAPNKSHLQSLLDRARSSLHSASLQAALDSGELPSQVTSASSKP